MLQRIEFEKTETGYSVYSPDLPGCVAVGETQEDARKNMQEAIEFHLEGMLAEGYAIREPSSLSDYIEVAANRIAGGFS